MRHNPHTNPVRQNGGLPVLVLEILVAAGGDVTAVSGNGDPIFLFVAVNQKDPEVASFLVAHGADVCVSLSDATSEKYGTSSVVELADAEGVPAVAELLREAAIGCPSS